MDIISIFITNLEDNSNCFSLYFGVYEYLDENFAVIIRNWLVFVVKLFNFFYHFSLQRVVNCVVEIKCSWHDQVPVLSYVIHLSHLNINWRKTSYKFHMLLYNHYTLCKFCCMVQGPIILNTWNKCWNNLKLYDQRHLLSKCVNTWLSDAIVENVFN